MGKKVKKESETPCKETVRLMKAFSYVLCEKACVSDIILCPLKQKQTPTVFKTYFTYHGQDYKAFICLSLLKQFEAVHVVGKTPATVVLLLSSPEEDILIKACEAVYTFAEKGTVGSLAAEKHIYLWLTTCLVSLHSL